MRKLLACLLFVIAGVAHAQAPGQYDQLEARWFTMYDKNRPTTEIQYQFQPTIIGETYQGRPYSFVINIRLYTNPTPGQFDPKAAWTYRKLGVYCDSGRFFETEQGKTVYKGIADLQSPWYQVKQYYCGAR